jgi:light-regulated signal transduction histidine kinase (bacteriophytochrome)
LEQATIEAVEQGKKWDIETLAVTKNNKTLWVRHIGEPVFNHQGQVVKVRGTLTDIDQYKKHELELSRALEATQKKTERLQKFSYVLSHNIRNHTSNLTALAELTDIEPLDQENKDVALKGRQVIQALNTTLNDLAQVMEAQDSTAVKESVSFEAAASKAVQALSHQISQADAEINQSFLVPDISFPSIYLDNIVKHLLSNAIRYCDPNKKLQINLSSYLNDGGRVVMECRDTGLGIDMELNGHKLFNLYATFHPRLSNRGVGLFCSKPK